MTKLTILWITAIMLFTTTAASQSKKGITPKIQRDIVRRMVLDGELDNSRVTEAGGTHKVVEIYTIHLARDGKAAYYVFDNDTLYSPHSRQWIYHKTNSGYEKIFGPEIIDDFVKVEKTRTNGYSDLTGYYRAPAFSSVRTYKFDGKRYSLTKSQESRSSL
jgi:hypothetical protein